MVLDIERQRGCKSTRAPEQQMLRQPASPPADAAGGLQRAQEFVAYKGLLASQCIPFRGRYGGQGIDDFDGALRFLIQRFSSRICTSRTSTEMLSP
jgi:hypothetical protein